MEMYQSFMAGYVKRINQATLNVTIGGIRIGTAKYSRLAQINLDTRIITFSRFAIENVPERGRRYLVLHELAHVREASHNSRFWELVGRFEPRYRQIGRELDLAFKRNVREDQARTSKQIHRNRATGRIEEPKLFLAPALYEPSPFKLENFDPPTSEQGSERTFECLEDQFDSWDDDLLGTISGGSELAHSLS